jgi:hypothetical protein
MAWKAEKWLAEIFPGLENIFSEYRQLSRRELGIVACAVLDGALAELLSMRLADKPRECEEFLGLNEDGRAACASFGARIQLAQLLNVITDADAAILRGIKNIRNKLAHRAQADFTSPEVLPLVKNLHDNFAAQSNRLIEMGHLSGSKHTDEASIRPLLDTIPEAGAGLLLAVFAIYQAYFYRLSSLIERIPPIKVTNRI